MSTSALAGLLHVERVLDGEFYIGDLFRGHFRCDPPSSPTHLVAFYKADRNCYVTVGYMHCMTFDDICVFGGVVEDERALRRMPPGHQADVRQAGGVTACLLRAAILLHQDLAVLCTRTAGAEMRSQFSECGFQPIDDPYVMVKWNSGIPVQERPAWIPRIQALGAF